MKSAVIPIVVISSLLAVGILGFLGFGAMNHGIMHNCPIPLMVGVNCPSENDALASVFYHISGLQRFIQPMIYFRPSFLASLLLLIIFSLLVFSKFSQKVFLLQPLSYQKCHNVAEHRFITRRQFLRWLSLHYKRDPHILQWVHNVYPECSRRVI